MTSELDEALGRVVGSLSGGGEPREGQQAMARAVEEALSLGRHLSVQAGTGTGKSFAYLVPAALSGKRVVVATATKALQDQLASKDLPLVAAALPERHLRFAVLKGRSNYLCRQRLAEAKVAGEQATLSGTPFSGAGTAEGLEEGALGRGRAGEEAAKLSSWAATTATGDRAELAEEPDPRVWAAFSVTAEECPGPSRCPQGGSCFAEAARAAAAEADVVVVNLHLLGADVASAGAVLAEYDALVVDEAHALEDVLTDSLGRSVGAGRIRALAGAARLGLAGGPRSGAGHVRGEVEELVAAADRLEAVLTTLEGNRLTGLPEGELAEALGLLSGRLERLETMLRRRVETGQAGPSLDPGDQAATRAVLLASRLRSDLLRLLDVGDDEVAWVEGGPRPSLMVAPLDVSAALVEQVLSKVPVVMTSATLPAGLAGRLGAPESRELDVGSPFAYDRQAMLYCAAHLPDRRNSGAEEAMHEEMVALVEAAGGRTLALFTSWGAMQRAATVVAEQVSWPILVQGGAAKGALLESFVAEPGACLFATMGFWQGVDVPGATLSCVVIDRIPFPRPSDPLVAARRERAGKRAFQTIDLPRAASLLAQGAGRLVRTSEDRGVVAVLDSRLATASYRWDLVRALPPMRRTRHREEAEAFLRQIHAEALLVEGVGPSRPQGSFGAATRRGR